MPITARSVKVALDEEIARREEVAATLAEETLRREELTRLLREVMDWLDAATTETTSMSERVQVLFGQVQGLTTQIVAQQYQLALR